MGAMTMGDPKRYAGQSARLVAARRAALGKIPGPGAATGRSSAGKWAAGAGGERTTGELLEDLGDSWVVLHDRRMPDSKANLDHLLLGPPGVFLLDTKRYAQAVTPASAPQRRPMSGPPVFDAAQLTLNGASYAPTLSPTLWEASTVAKVLRVPVHPLVVIHGAEPPEPITRVKHPESTEHVILARPSALLGHLRSLPPALTSDEVRSLGRAAHAALKPCIVRPPWARPRWSSPPPEGVAAPIAAAPTSLVSLVAAAATQHGAPAAPAAVAPAGASGTPLGAPAAPLGIVEHLTVLSEVGARPGYVRVPGSPVDAGYLWLTTPDELGDAALDERPARAFRWPAAWTVPA